jgi:hypothetical protein
MIEFNPKPCFFAIIYRLNVRKISFNLRHLEVGALLYKPLICRIALNKFACCVEGFLKGED